MHAESTVSPSVPHADTDWPYKIPLRRRDGTVRAYALVDEQDYATLSQWRWSLHATKGYVFRAYRVRGRQLTISIHRQIFGLRPGDGMEVDHIEGSDKLDNRRSNLRGPCDHFLQMQNVVSHADSTSPYRGVSLHRRSGKWRAEACIAYKHYYLGLFEYPEDARDVALAFREEHMPYSVDR